MFRVGWDKQTRSFNFETVVYSSNSDCQKSMFYFFYESDSFEEMLELMFAPYNIYRDFWFVIFNILFLGPFCGKVWVVNDSLDLDFIRDYELYAGRRGYGKIILPFLKNPEALFTQYLSNDYSVPYIFDKHMKYYDPKDVIRVAAKMYHFSVVDEWREDLSPAPFGTPLLTYGDSDSTVWKNVGYISCDSNSTRVMVSFDPILFWLNNRDKYFPMEFGDQYYDFVSSDGVRHVKPMKSDKDFKVLGNKDGCSEVTVGVNIHVGESGVLFDRYDKTTISFYVNMNVVDDDFSSVVSGFAIFCGMFVCLKFLFSK